MRVTVTYPPAARIVDVVAIPGAVLSADGRTLIFDAPDKFDFLVQDVRMIVGPADVEDTVKEVRVRGARRAP
jgi:hypothetical protein